MKSDPRQRIIDTALNLFHKQGYRATGVNQVINEAKVAKASFYLHFHSKDDLCVAFLQKRHDFWFEKLLKFNEKAILPEDKIMASFNFIIEMNATEDFRGCSFINTLSEIQPADEKIRKVICDHKTDLLNYFKSLTKTEALAEHVYLLFEGALVESQLFRDNWPVERAKKTIQTLID